MSEGTPTAEDHAEALRAMRRILKRRGMTDAEIRAYMLRPRKPTRDRRRRKPLPKRVRFAVLERDGFRCRYCGRGAPAVVLHADHVIPRSKGGPDTLANLVAACADCNGGKAAKAGVEPPA